MWIGTTFQIRAMLGISKAHAAFESLRSPDYGPFGMTKAVQKFVSRTEALNTEEKAL
ncbi:hypothetical protein AG1IA_05615 [Rhizoctonia solani AG-1 IA]|uniref:Uncharacterized protein n=1 Tax=Thanatephorus cucumeris (strain AG1-IA) TaxID=983506 RepID=L8WQS8_THACA|nr:hypothetical protein AG1IA_05615 [Rhizoctonia solani AG-1 IA]